MSAAWDVPGTPDPQAAPSRGPKRIRQRALIVIAVGIALVVASLLAPLLERGETYEIVFGPGAADARDQAAVFDTVPLRRVGDVVWLELEPGDTLVVRNLDDEVHQVAGIAARPGETVLHTFRERGVFSDECSLDLTVFVEVGRR
jgi:hypothetical protein